MPACTLHLISISPQTTLLNFLSLLKSTSSVNVLLVSKVIRWVIRPEKLSVDALLHPSKSYDLFLITLGTDPLPLEVKQKIQCHWTIRAGVPSRLTTGFQKKNQVIVHPDSKTVPALTGSLDRPRVASSSQGLELSPELQKWIDGFSKGHGQGAVSMLNLLAFKEGKKESYLKYGTAFAKSIGSKRGGNAKIVGNVIDKQDGWDEIAVAHYPSILHFADMLASEDYQEVNQEYRIPALKDTCILCTSEIALEEGQRVSAAKL